MSFLSFMYPGCGRIAPLNVKCRCLNKMNKFRSKLILLAQAVKTEL